MKNKLVYSANNTISSHIGCVIMASGQGKRFGSNKLLAPFLGKPLLAHLLSRTEGLFEARLVVTTHSAVVDLCREYNVPVLLHTFPHRSDTIKLGLTALLEQFPEMTGCIFCPGDQPCIELDTMQQFIQSHVSNPTVVLRLSYLDEIGAPVLFPASFFPALKELPTGKGGRELIKNAEQVQLIPAQHPFELFDIDCPEDLLLLRQQKI